MTVVLTVFEPKENLALLLHDDTRTIRRDIRELRAKKNIYVAMRGQIRDISSGVSHKGVAIGQWLAGLESLGVAHRINHARGRAVYSHLLPGGARAFLDIHEAPGKKPECARRFEEIDPIGVRHDEAEDGGG